MCKDCFDIEIYKFKSSEEVKNFMILFNSKIEKPLHFVKSDNYNGTNHEIYRCFKCNQNWWFSDPNFPWHGYFLKEKNAKEYIDKIKRKEKNNQKGCFLVVVIIVIIFLFYFI